MEVSSFIRVGQFKSPLRVVAAILLRSREAQVTRASDKSRQIQYLQRIEQQQQRVIPQMEKEIGQMSFQIAQLKIEIQRLNQQSPVLTPPSPRPKARFTNLASTLNWAQMVLWQLAEGHEIDPNAIKTLRADSFVMETNIHYPTESSLIRDGLRKILQICSELAVGDSIVGWRQHHHLWKRVKQLAREIDRIAARKGRNYVTRMQVPYHELLQKAMSITQRARQLCTTLILPNATAADVFGPNTLQAFIARTERVIDTATRRILNNETVSNSDKLFSVFEPHTQLYKRGKAGEPIQFGRQVLVFEDAAGFIVKSVVMKRNQCDSGVAIEATKAVQTLFENKIERLSFDRGFHSPENQAELSKIIPHLCLPKPGSKQSVVQMANADDEFLEAQQNHPGIESAIGALQSGNGMERCRDRSELGFERYVSLAILGRNMHTLGRMLIAAEAANSLAASTRRKAA